ncbi:hypothetical protein B0T22DRAFT_115466 [Podospora appendiculata]|uniref:Modin n=1 Tax=Podospora appendiculata TaxID=314037 RepID=A0AAE0XLK3_9PEZI|nr:hypothetical protein B0T22DRAFT_115466 [Podospora appendiculata]
MSSNDTSASSPGDDGNNDSAAPTELIIAITALVISVGALVISLLQALQQYFSSAKGYTSCSKEVIGGWADNTYRRLRWSEFRFEVHFTVPVIFVARPENKRGPLGEDGDVGIVVIDGTDGSLEATHTSSEVVKGGKKRTSRHEGPPPPPPPPVASAPGVHTAINEEATWLSLITAIQRMERESCEWQQRQQGKDKSRNGRAESESSGYEPSQEVMEPNTGKGASRRRRPLLPAFAWPGTSSTATTSAAAKVISGRHYQDVTRRETIPGRSLAVCLQQKPKTWDNMPDSVTKPYAITTFAHLVEMTAMLGIYWKEFNRDDDSYRAQGNGFSVEGFYVEGLGVAFTFQKTGPTWFEKNRVVPRYDVKELCFGLAPTVFRPRDEVQYADEPKGKGMLQLGSAAEIADTLAVFGCNITTVNHFRKSHAGTRRSHIFAVPFEILGMVGKVLQVPGTVFRMLPNPTIYHWDTTEQSLKTMITEFGSAVTEHSLAHNSTHIPLFLDAIRTINSAFASWDRDATETKQLGNSESGAVAYTTVQLTSLHAAITTCDALLTDPAHESLVLLVLGVHIQEILDLLNEPPPPLDSSTSTYSHSPITPTQKPTQSPSLIQQLDSADAESRLYLLIDIYMTTIRARVVEAVSSQLAPDSVSGKRRSSISIGGWSRALVGEVWCALVLRMLCWLLLHDFHRKDVQIGGKSEVFESRMAVYVL